MAGVNTLIERHRTIAAAPHLENQNGSIVTTKKALAAPMKSLVVDIEPVQSGSGDPSPTNVRPIGGWTGANVTVSPTTDVQDATICPIAFPSEAGTVYGGTLDVTTGVLTVDRAKATINGSESVTWTVVSETTHNFAYVNANSFLPGANRTTNYIQQKDMYNIMTATHARSRVPNTAFIDGGYLNLAFDISTVSTDTELKAWLANNPLEVVYELATPQTYQLTPIQIALLAGENNVWADTGDITMKFWSH